MIVVTWGEEGYVAVVEEDGTIIDVSDEGRAELTAVLRAPVIEQLAPVGGAEATRDLNPGEPGHARAALRNLEQSILT